MFLDSDRTRLNLIVKTGIKSAREISVMVPVEMVVMMTWKMGSLVKMGKFSRFLLSHFLGSQTNQLDAKFAANS